jgi:hypothetical protein
LFLKIAEIESKLRNADTTTVLTRLLPSATLENRLKEEEERTQQLRNWTNKLTEKIEHFQKVKFLFEILVFMFKNYLANVDR